MNENLHQPRKSPSLPVASMQIGENYQCLFLPNKAGSSGWAGESQENIIF